MNLCAKLCQLLTCHVKDKSLSDKKSFHGLKISQLFGGGGDSLTDKTKILLQSAGFFTHILL